MPLEYKWPFGDDEDFLSTEEAIVRCVKAIVDIDDRLRILEGKLAEKDTGVDR